VNRRLWGQARPRSLPMAGVALVSAFLGWLVFDFAESPAEGVLARVPPAYAAPGSSPPEDVGASAPAGSASRPPTTEIAALRAEQKEMRSALASRRPRGAYIVVDRANNRIYLRKGDSVLVDAPASTGSGAILRERSGQQRSWTFDTPSGRFRILAERPDPVWTKPDWAFLEEGKPIPSLLSERREAGSLGEYALDLGDGYMIHGTLYERLLGRAVTHGCVRVGREALRTIARSTGPGSQVFIY
jgi:lipoprotein-anchoring transpeptidase ErfK/SrfK